MAAIDNRPRFPETRRGFYEVYYMKAHHAKEGLGLWLRYTFHRPLNRELPAQGHVWAIVFNRKDPSKNIAIKNDYSLEQCRFDLKRPRLYIGQNMLSHGSLRGKAGDGENCVEWSLEFNPNEEAFFMLPPLAYKLPVVKSKVISPNLHVYIYGVLTINGRKIDFNGEPGQQSHIFGTKHADAWGWAHCNAFAGKPRSVMELITARSRIFRRQSPWMPLFFFNYEGKHYRFNTLTDILRNRISAEPGQISFTCNDGSVKFEGKVSAPQEHFVGVTYEDPDGEHLYCYNSTVASVQLDLFVRQRRRWEKVDSLEAKECAAMEYATRQKLPDYPLHL